MAKDNSSRDRALDKKRGMTCSCNKRKRKGGAFEKTRKSSGGKKGGFILEGLGFLPAGQERRSVREGQKMFVSQEGHAGWGCALKKMQLAEDCQKETRRDPWKAGF